MEAIEAIEVLGLTARAYCCASTPRGAACGVERCREAREVLEITLTTKLR